MVSAPRPEICRQTRAQRKKLLYTLFCFLPFLGGCGLGWLYMRVADSERIKAMKLLTYDSTKDRFTNAQKLWTKAIENYRESIMYDDVGNPMVYHKLGFTLMLLSEPDIYAAEKEFKNGIKLKKQNANMDTSGKSDAPAPEASKPAEAAPAFKKDKQDTSETPTSAPPPSGPKDPSAEARTEEEIGVDNETALAENRSRKDEDWALMNSGMGLVHFLRGIATKKEEEIRLAAKYFKLADKYSSHPTWNRKQGTFAKLMSSFDLEEIIDPTPHLVLLARVHNYLAKKYLNEGQGVLAESELTKAQDALDSVKIYYEKEPRYLAEQAEVHFLRKEYDKCIAVIKQISTTQGYADLKVTNTLKCRALIQLALTKGGSEKQKLIEEAMSTVQDLLDRDPEDMRALLMRAACYAYMEPRNYTEMKSNIDQVFANPKSNENAQLLMEAGDIYFALAEDDKKAANAYYLKAYYIDTKDIKANYQLGKSYQALAAIKSTAEDQAANISKMKDCFMKVHKIDPTSTYAKEIAPLIQ